MIKLSHRRGVGEVYRPPWLIHLSINSSLQLDHERENERNTDTNFFQISADNGLFACQQPGVNLLHNELCVHSMQTYPWWNPQSHHTLHINTVWPYMMHTVAFINNWVNMWSVVIGHNGISLINMHEISSLYGWLLLGQHNLVSNSGVPLDQNPKDVSLGRSYRKG